MVLLGGLSHRDLDHRSHHQHLCQHHLQHHDHKCDPHIHPYHYDAFYIDGGADGGLGAGCDGDYNYNDNHVIMVTIITLKS